MSEPFSIRLTHWQRAFGRHDLPWNTTDPYAIWLSEIMLQQTQVSTVIPYFNRFVERFPSVAHLAHAELDDVLAYWAGLGYYTRARNLHKAARMVMQQFAGVFPTDAKHLESLPGIGRSTAAAIAAFSVGQRVTILDGNVKRVLARWAGIEGFPGEKAVENRLWQLAETTLPAADHADLAGEMRAYTQGLMDLGSILCKRSKPDCPRCPLRDDCVAWHTGRTDELPERRTRKEIPARSTVMLLLRHGDRIMLEKRPPSGIWGGLWSLPECDLIEDAVQSAIRRFGVESHIQHVCSTLIHTFTHFRLHISPVLLDVQSISDQVTEPNVIWMRATEALKLGIPTPTRKLLLTLQ